MECMIASGPARLREGPFRKLNHLRAEPTQAWVRKCRDVFNREMEVMAMNGKKINKCSVLLERAGGEEVKERSRPLWRFMERRLAFLPNAERCDLTQEGWRRLEFRNGRVREFSNEKYWRN